MPDFSELKLKSRLGLYNSTLTTYRETGVTASMMIIEGIETSSGQVCKKMYSG